MTDMIICHKGESEFNSYNNIEPKDYLEMIFFQNLNFAKYAEYSNLFDPARILNNIYPFEKDNAPCVIKVKSGKLIINKCQVKLT